jgi:hypothetical protein
MGVRRSWRPQRLISTIITITIPIIIIIIRKQINIFENKRKNVSVGRPMGAQTHQSVARLVSELESTARRSLRSLARRRIRRPKRLRHTRHDRQRVGMDEHNVKAEKKFFVFVFDLLSFSLFIKCLVIIVETDIVSLAHRLTKDRSVACSKAAHTWTDVTAKIAKTI